MTGRMARRAVFAELLLTGSPNALRAFDAADGPAVSVEFDTIAELRAWLDAAGLNTPDLLAGESDGVASDGRPYRSMNAYPAWHGWEIYARAVEHVDAAPLDAATADRLAALAVTS